MSAASRLLEVAADAARIISQWIVGKPFVFYQAGFADEQMVPVIDLFGLGSMQTAVPTNIGGALSTAIVPVGPTFPNGGIRLTITKPLQLAPTDTVAAGIAVLNPLPPNVNVLLVEATYLQPRGPHGETDQWASVVHAREGTVSDAVNPKTAILVTLQAAFRKDTPARPGARVNTPGGEPIPSAIGFLPDTVYQELFETPPFHVDDVVLYPSIFTLNLRITRYGEPAKASISAYSYDNYCLFVHPELAKTENLTLAGVNIAIANGFGPAEVMVRDFRLIGMRAVPWIPVVSTVGAALMRVAVLRRVRTWLVDLALGSEQRRAREHRLPDRSSTAN